MNSNGYSAPPALPRRALATTLTLCLGLAWVQALARLLLPYFPSQPAQWAAELSVASSLLCGGVSMLGWTSVRSRTLVLGSALIGLGLATLMPQMRAAWSALALVAAVSGPLSRSLASQLPAQLDAVPWRRRAWVGLWLLSAVMAVVQLARLATWINDPSSDWFLSTRHPFWAKHECLPAYVYGAELGLRGEPNVYAASHYPGLQPDARPSSGLVDMPVEDPYVYAPQFLLWPAAALLATQDYPTLRALWFALQLSGFMLVALGLLRWVGGTAGTRGHWMLPLVLSAFPVLHCLQYGQFHLAAVAVAIAAMLAFESGRARTGGVLLSVATLSKLFPGVLLLVLAAQRRWRAVGYTLLAGVVLTLATLVVFGTTPFEAFASYHVPRLRSGTAFAFGEAWPEVRDLILAANQGVYGLVLKLRALGVPFADNQSASNLNTLYAAVLAAVALWLGRRGGQVSREARALSWLALIGLASLMSTGAFADYVPCTAIWLLSLIGLRGASLSARAGLCLVWVFQYTLLGTTPLLDFFDARIMLPLSAVGSAALFGLFGVVLWRALRPHAASAVSPGSVVCGGGAAVS